MSGSPNVRKALFFAVVAAGAIAPASAQLVKNYEYDALGRLIRAEVQESAETAFEYDAAGNRETVSTSMSVIGGGATSTSVNPLKTIIAPGIGGYYLITVQ